MKISTALSGFDITTSTEQNTFQNQPVTVDPVACQAAWPVHLSEVLANTQKDFQNRELSNKMTEDSDAARYEQYLKGAIDEDAFGCGLEDIPWPSRLVQVEFKYGWSVGTALHDSGTCKPCCFITSQPGCLNGVECDFCHMRHKRSDRPRPGKQKRERFKKCQTRVYDEAETKSLVGQNGAAGRNRQLSAGMVYDEAETKSLVGQNGVAGRIRQLSY